MNEINEKSICFIENLNKENLDLMNSEEYCFGSAILKLNLKALKNFLIRKLKKMFGLANQMQSYFKGNRFAQDIKSAVYTSITANYDNVKEPFSTFNSDFWIYSNATMVLNNSLWKLRVLQLNGINTTGNMFNRYCKFHPFELFKDYDYSVYVDGNVTIVSDVSQLFSIAHDSKCGIAMHRHQYRNCAYAEAKKCLQLGKGNANNIKKQMQQYKKEGFPHDYGLCEATIIVVDLKNSSAKTIMDAWWQEYCIQESFRDQLSFPYVLWKLGYKIEDIGNLGYNEYKNPIFRIGGHS